MVADGDLGADLGGEVGAVADVGADEVGPGRVVRIADRGGGDLDLAVAAAPARPAAGVDRSAGDSVHLIVGDDELRIER